MSAIFVHIYSSIAAASIGHEYSCPENVFFFSGASASESGDSRTGGGGGFKSFYDTQASLNPPAVRSTQKQGPRVCMGVRIRYI